jgi:hypothetical protein
MENGTDSLLLISVVVLNSFTEEELVKLDSRQSDYIVGQLGLKGAAGTTNRATRAASRM